jgi:hypothetical protein
MKHKPRFGLYTIVAVSVVISFFPIVWLILTSFKNTAGIYAWPPQYWPEPFTLGNYISIFTNSPELLRYILNSFIVGVGATTITLLLGGLSAYALSRLGLGFAGVLMIQNAMRSFRSVDKSVGRLLDFAGQPTPSYMQGRSARKVFEGDTPADWPQLAYHRYWMHRDPDHNAYSHYGVRNQRYKLIYWYNEGYDLPGTNHGGQDREWELFDCEKDPLELFNVIDDPAYGDIRVAMQAELDAKMAEIGDDPVH